MQPRLVGAEPKEVIPLGHLDERRAVLRASAVDGVAFEVEVLATGTIPAAIFSGENVVRSQASQECVDGAAMRRIRGTLEVIDGNVERLGQPQKAGRVLVDELLHGDPACVRREDVLERVLVGAGLEPNVAPDEPIVSGDDVSLDQLEREADVRRRVDVRNRGRHEELRGHGSPRKNKRAPSRKTWGRLRNLEGLCARYTARLGTELARARRMLGTRSKERSVMFMLER